MHDQRVGSPDNVVLNRGPHECGLFFQTIPKIICQKGISDDLGEIVSALGVSRVMLVTDNGLAGTRAFDQAAASLSAANVVVTVYQDVVADPPEACVQAALSAASAARVNGVIGFGGGSSLDTAKLVALLARTPQSLDAIYGVNLARGPRWPLVQVPTTAGTGSEVTPIAIVTTRSHEKKGVVSPLLYADIALLDSLLTVTLPPQITAMTGVDAMVHAIEAYTSRLKKNAISDALAAKAMQLLYVNLPLAVSDGGDTAAREGMLLGSLLAGMAFANAPVAAVHALAYPLGGRYGLPHGLANSLVLSRVLDFNLPAATPLYAELGRLLMPSVALADDASAAATFLDLIGARIAAMPYAQTLRAAGVVEDSLPLLADDAVKIQRLLINNPREVTYEDALAIYRAAF